MAKIALELFPIPNSNLSSKAYKFQFWVRGTQVGGLDYLVRCLPSRPNHLRNIFQKELKVWRSSNFGFGKCSAHIKSSVELFRSKFRTKVSFSLDLRQDMSSSGLPPKNWPSQEGQIFQPIRGLLLAGNFLNSCPNSELRKN